MLTSMKTMTVLVAVSFLLVGRAQNAPQSPQTHWEPYRRNVPAPLPDRHLSDPALAGAIDLHAHHDPDSYPRNLDGFEVAKLALDRGMRGIVLKNHWTETAGLAY